MSKRHKITTIALAAAIVLLAASIGINAYLFQTSREYYLELNGTRLDPLGLFAYPSASLPLDQGAKRRVIVFVGDSRAAQWTAAPELSDALIINRGIGAQTTAQVLGRFDLHVAPLKPDIVIIQAGINDLKAIPLFPSQKAAIVQNCKANIQALAKHALASGARRVIVTTVMPIGQIPLERRIFWSDEVAVALNDVNDFIKSLASTEVVVFETKAVLADTQGIVKQQYSQDFLHINRAGYESLNRSLMPLLRE